MAVFLMEPERVGGILTCMMLGAGILSDEQVVAAVSGKEPHRSNVLAALAPQVKLMVSARLCATPSQYHITEELSQHVMVAVTGALVRLQRQNVLGLRAFVSGIVARKVADYLRGKGPQDHDGSQVVSLDETLADVSHVGPLWQFLSIGATTPSSAFHRSQQFELLMTELGKLKSEHRDVITLAFFDQLPTAQIAEVMGISRPAASMLLIRAVKTLRRRMTGFSQVDDQYASL